MIRISLCACNTELKKEIVMKFDWDNWNTGGRIIFVAACVATMSMFMNWVDIGITTRIGISQGAFAYLGFWIYPVLMLFNNRPINLAWGLLCATLSFVAAAFEAAFRSTELLGEIYNFSAIGAWVFLFASFALGVGVVKYARSGNYSNRADANSMLSNEDVSDADPGITTADGYKICTKCFQETPAGLARCRYCGSKL
jgi:hypothetical protein